MEIRTLVHLVHFLDRDRETELSLALETDALKFMSCLFKAVKLITIEHILRGF